MSFLGQKIFARLTIKKNTFASENSLFRKNEAIYDCLYSRYFTKLELFIYQPSALIMIRNILLSISTLLLFAVTLQGQQRSCGANDVLARQLLENPEMQQIMKDIERHTDDFIHSGGVQDRVQVTIPVVVHVVYFNTTQNLSDDKILSQIDVLNADFRRLNADASNTPGVWQSIAADCEINFCMATQDPNGNATTGIQRRQTTVNGFSTNDNMKFFSTGGLDAWDSGFSECG